jgi:glucose/arabinose dehydrogenase
VSQKIKLTLVSCLLLAMGTSAVVYVWPRLADRCGQIADVRMPGVDLIEVTGVRMDNPTRVAIGPSGEVWVAERFGLIRLLQLEETLIGFRVQHEEIIDAIQMIENHNDDGSPQPQLKNRLITGLAVVGTLAEPIVYVASSDPRIDNVDIDSNSGVISRLRRVNGQWARDDLIRGLPRSKADHATNALVVADDQSVLYLLQGANTNAGAPSEMFFQLPEYALSGALLEFRLEDLETPYDLPTLDDEDRPGESDAHDPFGGNAGKNQAVLAANGPVQLFAVGLRNPYSMVLSDEGFYVTDNGANQYYGGVPLNDAEDFPMNAASEGGSRRTDSLYLIDRRGYDLGHPNPTRSNPRIFFNATNPQRPVAAEATRTGPIRQAAQGVTLATFERSTNGLVWINRWQGETAERGFLATVDLSGVIRRFRLGLDGRPTDSDIVLRSFRMLLDAAVDSYAPHAEVIWTIDHGWGALLAIDLVAEDRPPLWRATRAARRLAMEVSCSIAGVERRQ